MLRSEDDQIYLLSQLPGYSQVQLVRGLGDTVGVELHQLKQVDQHHTHQGFVIGQVFSQLEIIIIIIIVL